MKRLYLIGGTMGVGKTAACKLLCRQKLSNSVFLDGDWCWDAHPFTVTEETKEMVVNNICHLLNNFLRCSAYQTVVYCWVMHEQKMLNDILSGLDTKECRVIPVSLVCSRESLEQRLQRDVSKLSPEEAAGKIYAL